MDFIPAIDLKEGACVRLRQGRMDQATRFSEDPIAMAEHWASCGARKLHIVDLDGAFAGAPVHADLIASMIAAIPNVEVQIGGGLRNLATLEYYLQVGAKRLVIGTKAIQEPAFLQACARQFPSSILYGLDVRNGLVALSGWTKASKATATELVQAMGDLPLAGVIYTDISKDGMLEGVNVESTLALAKTSPVPVIASGGVANLADLEWLLQAQQMQSVTLGGVIVGRALYEGTLNCTEALALCQAHLK